MTGISNGFDHHHLHSGGTNMSLCKLHECFANALSLILGRYGNDMNLSHLIFRMNRDSNESSQLIILGRQPDFFRLGVE